MKGILEKAEAIKAQIIADRETSASDAGSRGIHPEYGSLCQTKADRTWHRA